MEVHAHTHTERKKFTHYLWEFLMLFLAVFLGFLAENQREHIVEHRRAKEYAKSLFADLQNDIADIKKGSYFEQLTNLMIDSLVDIEHDKDLSKKGGAFYYYIRMASWSYTIDWNKATMNQLINSGNLRYFNDPELITKISEYNTLSNTINDLQNLIATSGERAATNRDFFLNSQYYRLFTRISMDDLYDGKNSEFIDSIKQASIPIYKNDPDLLNQHANALLGEKTNRTFLLKVYFPKAIKQAVEIMELLKKEYHLK